jgi:hypothetical protein
MWKFVLAFFLIAHGLIHLGYMTPAPPDPRYPFSLSKSWLITGVGLEESAVRTLGTVLGIVTVIACVLAGLAAAGFIVSQAWWLPLTVVASGASLLLLVLFWHPWLVLGVVIDVAFLVALLWFHWQPFVPASA